MASGLTYAVIATQRRMPSGRGWVCLCGDHDGADSADALAERAESLAEKAGEAAEVPLMA